MAEHGVDKHMATDINLVLAEYEEAAASGATRLEAWVVKYPEHREALLEFAIESEVLRYGTDAPYDAAEESRILEHARAVANKAVSAQASELPSSLLERARDVGLTPAVFADRIGVGLALLAKFERRLIKAATIPRAMVEEIGKTLNLRTVAVTAYLRQPSALSASASYKSSKTPSVYQERFQVALKECPGMTDNQKQRWAAETDLLEEEN